MARLKHLGGYSREAVTRRGERVESLPRNASWPGPCHERGYLVVRITTAHAATAQLWVAPTGFPGAGIGLPRPAARPNLRPMFSHVVIFWTDPANPAAAEELIAGAERYLKAVPGVVHFHVGRMVPSHRPVVEQSYQVALNVQFADKRAQDNYQVDPSHLEFVEKVFKRVCKKVVVYDFE